MKVVEWLAIAMVTKVLTRRMAFTMLFLFLFLCSCSNLETNSCVFSLLFRSEELGVLVTCKNTMIMCVDFQTSHDTKENDGDDDDNNDDDNNKIMAVMSSD